MSHALFLRLAESSHWSIHSALHYLASYNNHIGISHYITRKLQDESDLELRDVWGFICHLLVTRPSKSAALECFVTQQVHNSTHLTLMTLWFLQAHLKELADHESHSFIVCERVMQTCHEIIYGSMQTPVHSASRVASQMEGQLLKLPPHFHASLVGIGSIIAGCPGVPKISDVACNVAFQQARHGDGLNRRQQTRLPDRDSPSAGDAVDSVETSSSTMRRAADYADDVVDSEEEEDEITRAFNDSRKLKTDFNSHGEPVPAPKSPLLKLRHGGLPASQTNPVLPLPTEPAKYAPGSGSVDYRLSVIHQGTHMSTPSLPISMPSSQFDQHHGLIPSDVSSQSTLLRKHYLQSQVNLMLTLESISNKLVAIPKPARLSVLRAQLTALNHKLPAECCIPLWCESSDAAQRNQSPAEPHHKIVRIPAGECVVLNSAQRAPYLLLVEFLSGDLSFDPSKRSNKGLLRKIAGEIHDDSHLSGLALADPLIHIATEQRNRPPPHPAESEKVNEEPAEVSASEEVDVVEQVYGTGPLNHFSENWRATPPSLPQNKDLDTATWSQPGAEAKRAEGSQVPYDDLQNSTDLHSSLTSLTIEQYAERMSTAAAMLAQLNSAMTEDSNLPQASTVGMPWLSGSRGASVPGSPGLEGMAARAPPAIPPAVAVTKVQRTEAVAIRDRIMLEMNALEEERMRRMRLGENDMSTASGSIGGQPNMQYNDAFVRQELRKEDPSAAIFSEPWSVKKSRIRSASPYGHLANWNCASVIVKTGTDLRQEQIAVQLIREFSQIWLEERCHCYVRPFHVLITGPGAGLVETITDSVSIHSIKKSLHARRLSASGMEPVTLLEHFVATYGETHTSKFIRAQRNFARSLAGYSLVTYFLQIKDRHNGNILLDRDGHLVHIDFGFILSNSPGSLGFEAAPFKLPLEYVELLGGIDSDSFKEFQALFRAGFVAARKHHRRIVTLVQIMQKDSTLPCFATSGEQTAAQLENRFQPNSAAIGDHIDRLIISSLGSAWTRLYDSFQWYSQGVF